MPGPHSPNPGVGTNGPAPYPEPSSHEPQALDYPHDLGAAEPADRKSTRLNSSHMRSSRMPSSA